MGLLFVVHISKAVGKVHMLSFVKAAALLENIAPIYFHLCLASEKCCQSGWDRSKPSRHLLGLPVGTPVSVT